MAAEDSPATVPGVLLDVARHPVRYLIRQWNWKSSVTSGVLRACVYFSTNLSAGLHAAVTAMGAEFVFRLLTSGFYGSLTQAFRKAHPAWAATLTVMVLLPIFSHSLEFLYHSARGTPKLQRSITVSVMVTVISTLFNMYAMRRGVLIVGAEQRSLWHDMKTMPRVIGGFLAAGPMAAWRYSRSRLR